MDELFDRHLDDREVCILCSIACNPKIPNCSYAHGVKRKKREKPMLNLEGKSWIERGEAKVNQDSRVPEVHRVPEAVSTLVCGLKLASQAPV